MFRIKKQSGVWVFLMALVLSSCQKHNDSGVCTEVFISITIRLTNSANQPIILDEAYTLRNGSNQKIIFEQSATGGTYVVLDDFYTKFLKNAEAGFRFIGKKNNQVLVDLPYTIAADGCHIFRKSGHSEHVVQ
jgi:hypothetical protein